MINVLNSNIVMLENYHLFIYLKINQSRKGGVGRET